MTRLSLLFCATGGAGHANRLGHNELAVERDRLRTSPAHLKELRVL